MNISFLGIGSMGAAMVPNLVAAGHHVSVWNRNPAPAQALKGVKVLSQPGEAFQSDAVLTMLSNDEAVRDVILNSGALTHVNPACIHVMMATISIALVEELIAAHQAAGIGYLSAPVFGVPAAAAKAQLNILVAGDPAHIRKVQPLFDALGRQTWPLGDDPRHANIAKIAGNMMLALAMEAMGEASALTEHYGLSAKDFLNVVTNTIFAAPSYQRYGSFIATNTYEPGFKLPLGLKDVNLALAAAKDKSASLPNAELVRENMQQAVDEGLTDKDWSVLAKITRRRAGISKDKA